MPAAFAYLASDKLYLKTGDSPPRLIESPFAQSILDRATRDRQRNEWKGQGAGAGFGMGQMTWANQGRDTSARRVRITGLTRGASANEMIYALDTDAVGGLFIYEVAEQYERRIFHRREFVARNLSRHPADSTIALSMAMPDGSANIGVMGLDGKGLREVTEGDSQDEAPSWVPGEGKRLVFQSAGVARDQFGHVTATGNYAIQQLDLDKGDMQTLLEIEGSDCLAPKISADGTLYFIRRPYEPYPKVNPFKLMLDFVFFPFRLVRAFIHFFNFFSTVFSGKPLLTAGGPQREQKTQRYMMLWGKVVDAEKMLRASKDGDAAAIVPSSWQLISRLPNGDEKVLAKGVVAFDLLENGDAIYSNGSAVFQTTSNGKSEKLATEKMIEHVVALA